MSNPTLLEKQLDEMYKTVKKGEKLGRSRRWFAYSLKIIAGGAGLAIATGKVAAFDQELGIAVLIVVFVDSVFSNHMRLIAETEAAHAYAALGRRVKNIFNRDRDSVAQRAREGDPTAVLELDKMMKAAHDQLSSGIDEIQTRLAEIDIKALRSLSLDDERLKRNV